MAVVKLFAAYGDHWSNFVAFVQETIRGRGPGENIDRLRVPESQLAVIPAAEAQLSERQRKILAHALVNGLVATGWCMDTLDTARDAVHRDLVVLMELGLLARKGLGRATKYVPTKATTR